MMEDQNESDRPAKDRREHHHRRTPGEAMDAEDVYRHRRSDDDVEITIPFGSVRAHGKQAATFLLCACLFALGGYGLYLYDDHRSMNERKVTADHIELGKKLDEMVWILSKPEKEREKLDISMPPSLRDKIRDRERP